MARLHSCTSDLFAIDSEQNAEACLQVLSKYVNIVYLSVGSSGLVFKVYTTGGHALIVKVMLRNAASRQEIVTACEVDNEIGKYDATFARTHGWIACNAAVPADWKTEFELALRKNPQFSALRTEPVYYLVSEYAGSPVSKFRFSDLIQFKSFVFELFYSLGNAFKRNRFQHHDLHQHIGNILVLQNVGTRNRTYTVGTQTFAVCQDIRPKIIDFGASTLGADSSRVEMLDMVELLQLFGEYFQEDAPGIGPFLDKLTSSRFKTFDQLLQSPQFDALHCSGDAENIEPTNCLVCGQVATRQFQHAPSFVFCSSDDCVDQMGPVARIIKSDEE